VLLGKYISYFIIGLILFNSLNALAQERQYHVEYITIKDGLPTNETTSVFQDSRGFVWFGTSNGLCRYDGAEIKIYQYDPGNPSSISNNIVSTEIFEDKNGSLWFGTFGNGLNRFDVMTESFTHYLIDSSLIANQDRNFIHNIYQDSNGIIWIILHDLGSIFNKGLVSFDPQTENFQIFKQHKDNTDNITSTDCILALLEDSKGNFWCGTQQGVIQFDRTTSTFKSVFKDIQGADKLKSGIIFSLHEDTNENLWFATHLGLFVYHTDENFIAQTDYRTTTYQVLTDPNKNGQSIWISSDDGIFSYNIRKNKYLLDIHTLERLQLSDVALRFFFTETGDYWFASGKNRGAGRIKVEMNEFEYFDANPDPSQITSEVSPISFFGDDNGDLWVGTLMHGLIGFDPNLKMQKWHRYFPVDNENWARSCVTKIYRDNKGLLWVGCSGAGLNTVDPVNDKITHCRFFDKDKTEMFDFVIRDIFDDNDLFWVATWKGLFINRKGIDPETHFYKMEEKSLDFDVVKLIKKDSKGNLWIGTQVNGLLKLSPDNRTDLKFKKYIHHPSDTSSIGGTNIMSMHETIDGKFWIGTNNGLSLYVEEDDHFINSRNFGWIGNQNIWGIESDQRGYLWMLTDLGLMRFDTESGGYKTKIFAEKDGIPLNDDVNLTVMYKNKTGKIFVGSDKGYFSFYPDSIKDNKLIPRIYLTEFTINNKQYKLDTSITAIKQINLNHNQNFFSFGFASLDYANPAKNQYAYYLEGLENDWIFSGTRRFANYTQVPPGKYIFRVKGSNNDGYWNEKGTYVRISIAPPPWKTWWAYTLYFLAVFAILYSLRRYEMKRQRLKQDLQLELLESDKLKELDKMKSQFFANISHEFRTPLTLILGPLEKIRTWVAEEGKNDLDIVHRNARRLQTLINQLLSLTKLEEGQMKLRARPGNIVQLTRLLLQSFQSMAEDRGIKTEFESDADEYIVYIDKLKFEKIVNNLLSNAFKFTEKGGKIKISVNSYNEEGNNGVTIKFFDTGIGIRKERLQHVFDRFYQVDEHQNKAYLGTGIGLALTKELVELHHGSIYVESEAGMGTAFTVFLPSGKDHLAEEEIVETLALNDLEDDEMMQALRDIIPNVMTKPTTIDEEARTDNNLPLLLIVEDNADMRDYIKGYLDEDYQLMEASNGKEGAEMAIKYLPDLIVSDLMMPYMDGNEMTQQLKNDERTSHIPIILLTAKSSVTAKMEGLETGADDFLTKPFDAAELLVRIKNMVEQRKRLRELLSRHIGDNTQTRIISETAGKAISKLDEQFLVKIKNCVEELMSDPGFSVEVLAKEMAMSRSQLHRKLKSLVDVSATDFIRDIRLQKAAELLKEGELNITQISYEIGISSLSYFSRAFKEKYGVTPSDFK
jgi:signal transduction histidine kinase/ligand-binding sensor domain-containing protein/DNA-binding response OmpR family regulator